MKYLNFKYYDIIFYSFLVWILVSGGLNLDNLIFLIGNFILFTLYVFGVLYMKYQAIKISAEYGMMN